MPVIQKVTSVPANDFVENVLSGSAFEFARQNILASMGLTAESAGLFATIQTGSDIVLEESEIAISTDFPIIPDEFYYQDVATPGDRIVVRLRNSTGAAINARTIVQVTNI
mgnify:CR=1 FL=1